MATAARPLFPNYVQMKQTLPRSAWYVLRSISLALAVGEILLCFVDPKLGILIFWSFFIPIVPLWFFVLPGLWRNVCPMATLNQTPREQKFTLGLTPPDWLRRYGFVISVIIFLAAASTRKVLFNTNATALGIVLAASLLSAFLGGYIFKGKGGWCSSICPLLPVQRVYGQTPIAVIPNGYCQPCVGCAKNCYDFNPRVAMLADLYDEDAQWTAIRRLFVGLFPGFIVGFYLIPNPPHISDLSMYLQFLVYMGASAGLYLALSSIVPLKANRLTALWVAAALNLYYWYNASIFANKLHTEYGWPVSQPLIWSIRGVVLVVALVFLYRTYRKEDVFVADLGLVSAPATALAAAGAAVAKQAAQSGQPEVTFEPDGKRVAAAAGRTLLDVIESSGLKIEAGCRMGMCGADPVTITGGMENLSAVRDDERNTLERLGLAENVRLACCAKVRGACSVSLGGAARAEAAPSTLAGFRFDASIKRVVIIGNGAAGTTAADHVRRRNPECEITVITAESYNFYNRMAIERLIYGRSAMQGLYLLQESWWEDHKVNCLLNTRVRSIDREKQEVVLGTNERLPYDRLILAMGSSSTVPAIEGFGVPGSFVLRSADDAIQIRAYAQQYDCKRAVVAGGGLLGLEAAHAIERLGLRVTVLERGPALLRRQLDARGSAFLQEYLEGLGLEIVLNAETAALAGSGRVAGVHLKDGRDLPCDIFLAAAGITPNIDLARAAGLECNRGVIVDDEMRTSDPHILAAGDVAEYNGEVFGLWPTACDQAEVAAANAVGGDKKFTLTTPVTMLKVVGVDLLSLGRYSRESREDVAIAQIEETPAGNHNYRRLLISNGKIVGGILLGFPRDAQNITAAVRGNRDVTREIEELKVGNWDVLGNDN
jgi:NADPH-dependent 2,4-dienoyl-CoA reductase/sulfur reductase-like enzyme/ferredoxin